MTSLCMCISMSGTVALCCFFAPKVYIAVCQPDKNVRMRQSALGHLVNQQMRFMRNSAGKNSLASSQITQQYGTIAPVIIQEFPDKCNAKSDNGDITLRKKNSDKHENLPLLKTAPFLHQTSNKMLHSDDELAKETIMYQNNELFSERFLVNYDVTFL
ncbi:hypothetical protein LOAG_06547 [Loa loa]|uniref:G-protein coupled receptors family 3 profile domain-containing protein n=1 Tax=Loa loa TaxID=7209 RepID=A0A1S0TXG6_LOALO|nr:hypothetical protein LOAG_06547 [Loa loa]EFO21937.2 hypothetical protein LOAG_06547 [Loa loa]